MDKNARESVENEMTQSTPTEAWLKEAKFKAKQYAVDLLKTDIPDAIRSEMEAHLAGQQCERERSAPDEQESFPAPVVIKCDPETEKYMATSGAVEMIKIQRRDNLDLQRLLREKDIIWRERYERDLGEAQAEAASLRAENIELRKVYSSTCPECGYAGCVRGRKACDTEIDTLRAQLAEATKALEFYAGETKHGSWRGNEFFAFDDFGGLDDDNVGQAEAVRTLAKLKAGRKEG